MSEFKYACPVCGQHIKCDTSQSGTVMDCPTCFQKIVAPQAPTNPDPKFVLTGLKYVARKPPTTLPGAFLTPSPRGAHFPAATVLLIALMLAAGSGLYEFRGTILKRGFSTVDGTAASTNQTDAVPMPAAPAASDTNWTVNLAGVTIPDGPVVGRIHGLDFVCRRATFHKGSLALRAVAHGAFEFGVTIDFSGEEPEVMAGKSINISNNVSRAAKVTLRWKENGEVKKAYFQDSYVLRLDFGALNGTGLPGKIYLCTPDDQRSYVMGSFEADTVPPKPKS